MEWKEYAAAETALFDEVRRDLAAELEPQDRVAANRYFDGSPVYPGKLSADWNRSRILEPAGEPVGAVVLLHGMTDSPYSLRHIAQHYRDRGFVAIAVRLPAHGTVPAALTRVEWEDWSAATRLAVREARRRAGGARPLHMVGYSTGGALSIQYALDAIDNKELSRPDRIVLISPMIGVTAFARFAGVVGWPALYPRFAKTAWLDIVPEYNPFKYNSFPVNAARQASLLTQALQAQIERLARENRLGGLAPILAFQSLADSTVSTPAVLSGLFAWLPANGSELVVFDLNRSARFGPILRPEFEHKIEQLLPAAPRRFRVTIIGNESADTRDVVERVVEPGGSEERTRRLGLAYPPDVYSLSHVALPFPMSDSLYGMTPTATDGNFGIHLGALAMHGEAAALVVRLDSLMRMSSNPFFPYLLERIGEGIPGR